MFRKHERYINVSVRLPGLLGCLCTVLQDESDVERMASAASQRILARGSLCNSSKWEPLGYTVTLHLLTYGPTLAHWLETHAMGIMPPPPGRSTHRERENDVGAPPRCTNPRDLGALPHARGMVESHRRLLLHAAPPTWLWTSHPIPEPRSLPAGMRAGTKGARPKPRSYWLRRHHLDKATLSSRRGAGVA